MDLDDGLCEGLGDGVAVDFGGGVNGGGADDVGADGDGAGGVDVSAALMAMATALMA